MNLQKAINERLENKNLKTQTLESTPENLKLVAEYKGLVKAINEMPQRLAGLQMNYRRRDIPMAAAKLNDEREHKMARLIELEKNLFPKKKNG